METLSGSYEQLGRSDNAKSNKFRLGHCILSELAEHNEGLLLGGIGQAWQRSVQDRHDCPTIQCPIAGYRPH